MTLDLLVTPSGEPKDIVTQCCLCREYKQNDHSYKAMDEKETHFIELTYNVSHGYCEPCMVQYMKDNDI